MRLVVLSRNGSLYSTSRILRAARARGHDVRLFDPLELQIAVEGRKTRVHHAGAAVSPCDAIIPRVGVSVTRHGMLVLRHLAAKRVVVLNDAAALAAARDKIGALSTLAAAGIDVPKSVCLRSPRGLDAAISHVGGPPVVVKLQAGTQGLGTILAESRNAAISTVETLLAMGQEVVVQAFVREARGRDQRLFVVGRRVVASMERRARRGEFRANLHRGGLGIPIDPPPEIRRVALRAARRLGLAVAGVDLLPTRNGPQVLEVNSSPGLEGIEQVTEVDIAAAIVRYAEGCVRRG
ncbi:MAG: RimK family alpha-L-glutamate ligase [Myxococcota bacterium]